MVFFICIQILKITSVSKHWRTPDQMPCFAASDLVLHCLPMSHKKDTRFIWVNGQGPFLDLPILRTNV